MPHNIPDMPKNMPDMIQGALLYLKSYDTLKGILEKKYSLMTYITPAFKYQCITFKATPYYAILNGRKDANSSI